MGIKKELFFSKRFIIFTFILSILVIGGTYSYFAFRYENDSTIVGNVIGMDMSLDVELMVGDNSGMVPLKDSALNSAINGTGGVSACVDANNNLSCQIYKITLTNNGSPISDLRGTIELYAKDGSTYTDLKWRELTSLTEIKDGSVVNGMERSLLVEIDKISHNEVLTYYIAVYIQETDVDQRNSNIGEFGGTVTFETYGGISETITSGAVSDDINSTYVSSDSGIDFSNISSDSNGKGIYMVSSTKEDAYPIYYYRGDVDNNNVLFANFCWKIVRTTETGGIKLIYNGTPTAGTCNNTGTNSQIGVSQFNSSYNSPAYVGYMQGDAYTYSSKAMDGITDTYYYGNDVTYSGGTYTLTDTISSNSWSSIYNGGLNNNHYTCLSTGTTCSSVYYVYFTNNSTAYYITLTNGKKVEDALNEMLTNPSNSKDSSIKKVIDTWYENNLMDYTDKLEDTVWCNDRSIGTLNGWDPNGGSTTSYLYFSAYSRNVSNKTPNLVCNNTTDKFTVDSSNGNGKLTYPVGLLTVDEMVLAGGKYGTNNSNYYLYTGQWYWSASPYSFNHFNASEFRLSATGNLFSSFVNDSGGVRPSVSLKPGTIVSGTGKGDAPYVVQ